MAEPTASGHNRGVGSANVKRALVVAAVACPTHKNASSSTTKTSSLPGAGVVYNHSIAYARFTIADPTPQSCPDAVGSANVNGFLTRHRLLGPHREIVGQY